MTSWLGIKDERYIALSGDVGAKPQIVLRRYVSVIFVPWHCLEIIGCCASHSHVLTALSQGYGYGGYGGYGGGGGYTEDYNYSDDDDDDDDDDEEESDEEDEDAKDWFLVGRLDSMHRCCIGYMIMIMQCHVIRN